MVLVKAVRMPQLHLPPCSRRKDRPTSVAANVATEAVTACGVAVTGAAAGVMVAVVAFMARYGPSVKDMAARVHEVFERRLIWRGA